MTSDTASESCVGIPTAVSVSPKQEVAPGNDGDCQFAQYFHSTTGGFTCQEHLNITKWEIAPSAALGGLPTFHADGTANVRPTSQTDPCLAFFPGQPSPFTDVGTLLPGFPGHFNLGPLFGFGELQIQVTEIS